MADPKDTNELIAPNGLEIVSIPVVTPGDCDIFVLRRDDEGNVVFEYVGGTEHDYDAQSTQSWEGEDVFFDEQGNRWLARELVCRKED